MSQRKIKSAVPSAQLRMQEKMALANRAQYAAMQRMQNNPLPEGEEGLGILRSLKECPVPPHTQELQKILSSVLDNPEIKDSDADQILQESTGAFLGSRRECAKSVRLREVCNFLRDEELAGLHLQLQEVDKQVASLQAQMQALINTAGSLIDQRWMAATRKYGLNPEKYSYRIDEERGTINLIDLNCADCKSHTVLKKAIANAKQVVAKYQEEAHDCNGKGRDPQEDGEAGVQE